MGGNTSIYLGAIGTVVRLEPPPSKSNVVKKLFATPLGEIIKCDIAEMNLICAYGLPGAGNLDIKAMLKTLDEWANRVKVYTRDKTQLYYARPDSFGTVARFRMACMLRVLVGQLRVRYNPALRGEPVPHPPPITDPADSFIHGLLSSRRTGTCVSIPVLITAIGRRLGYPLKLVHAPQHSFCRWDTHEERFNVEFNPDGLLNTPPDEYYYEWPFKWTPDEHRENHERPYFLLSLTPEQELAGFVFERGCLLDIAGRRKEALACLYLAGQLWPVKIYGIWTTHMTTKLFYHDKDWPIDPCEETCGKEAYERLQRDMKAAHARDPRSVWSLIS